MTRFWLVLSLLLSLWPASAMASPGVGGDGSAARSDLVAAASAEYAHEVFRAPTGLELLRSIRSVAPRGKSGSPDDHTLPGEARLPRRLPKPVSAARETARDLPALRFEHLPYFPTAPPVRR